MSRPVRSAEIEQPSKLFRTGISLTPTRVGLIPTRGGTMIG